MKSFLRWNHVRATWSSSHVVRSWSCVVSECARGAGVRKGKIMESAREKKVVVLQGVRELGWNGREASNEAGRFIVGSSYWLGKWRGWWSAKK